MRNRILIAATILTGLLTACTQEQTPTPQPPPPAVDEIRIKIDGTRDSIQVGVNLPRPGNSIQVTTAASQEFTYYEYENGTAVTVDCSYLPIDNWADTMHITIRVNGVVEWSAQGPSALIIH